MPRPVTETTGNPRAKDWILPPKARGITGFCLQAQHISHDDALYEPQLYQLLALRHGLDPGSVSLAHTVLTQAQPETRWRRLEIVSLGCDTADRKNVKTLLEELQG